MTTGPPSPRAEDARLVASSFSHRDNVRLWSAFVLGLVGVGGSFATIYASPVQKAAILPCGVEMFECSKALSTPISHLGGIPLGVFGVLYFAFWTMNLREYHRTGQDEYQAALTWGTWIGAIVSLSLGTYMFAVLRAPCLYCLVTHSSNLGALALLWPYRRFRPPDFTTNEVWHFLAMTAIAVLAASTTYFANAHRVVLAEVARLTQGDATAVEMQPETNDFEAIRDLPAALKRAAGETKNVLVFVYHPSCGACREFKRHVLGTPTFAEFAERNFVRVAVNARDADLSEFGRLPVKLSQPVEPRLFPTLSVLSPDGRVLFFDEGLSDYLDATPERFLEVLSMRMVGPTGNASPRVIDVKALNTEKDVSVGRAPVTVVEFWATWCAPCNKTFPDLERLYQQYRARGLEIIALSNDEDDSGILEFAARHGATFPVAFDPDQEIAERLGVTTLPTTFVFDHHGKERFRKDGYEEGDEETIEQAVRRVLAKPRDSK